jgi:hypothetical protein
VLGGRVRERGALPPPLPPPPYPYNTCCSKTHAHKTHNIQYKYRLQITETRVHKKTNVPVFYMALGLNDNND